MYSWIRLNSYIQLQLVKYRIIHHFLLMKWEFLIPPWPSVGYVSWSIPCSHFSYLNDIVQIRTVITVHRRMIPRHYLQTNPCYFRLDISQRALPGIYPWHYKIILLYIITPTCEVITEFPPKINILDLFIYIYI